MNPHWLNSSLIVAAASVVILPVASQTARPNKSGVYKRIEQATALKVVLDRTTAPLAFSISASGPVDPTNPTMQLFCNRQVQAQFRKAFMKTRNGEDRMGLAEAGRSIELTEGAIAFGPWATTDFGDGGHMERANRMNIARDDFTIAFFHTHGNSARAVPSARDLQGEVPDFVISRFAVYVTIPGTGSYLQLDPKACK